MAAEALERMLDEVVRCCDPYKKEMLTKKFIYSLAKTIKVGAVDLLDNIERKEAN